jgi:hypothetical protein
MATHQRPAHDPVPWRAHINGGYCPSRYTAQELCPVSDVVDPPAVVL